ncbi:MAG: MerR family transcriptional regulator [Xanthobacteraceae bacterium]|nr:MerR family transcriptional regulator [Xanthobacteraceae bacterium]
MDKAPDAFRTISEVAEELEVPQHVLRFWETRFPQIKPMKRSGGRRYYRPDDVDLLRGIRRLLYGEGYTIRGVQRILKAHGVGSVQDLTASATVAFGPIEPAAADDDDRDEAPRDMAGGAVDDDEGADDEEALAQGEPAPRREPELAAPPRREYDTRHAPDPPAGHGVAAGPLAAPRRLDRDRLRAVLAELIACRRLLDGALNDGARGDGGG